MNDEPISISAAARAIGVNKSTLARQLRDSSVAFTEGKVRLSDVLAFRASAIDLTRSKRREGRIDDVSGGSADATKTRVDATPPDGDATGEADDGEPVIVDGQTLSYSDARALKETYLARLRKHEFEIAMREWVRVEDVGRIVEREYGNLRQAILGMPGRLADRCFGLDRNAMKIVMDQAVVELLEHLSASADMAERAQA